MPVDRRDAWHARRLSRLDLSSRGRRLGEFAPRCRRPSSTSSAHPLLGLPVLTWFAIVAVVAAVFCALARAFGPRPLRRRLEPAGGGLCRHRSGPGAGHRLRASPARRGTLRLFLGLALRGRLCRRRARLRVAGHCRLRDRRRRPSPAASARSRASSSARFSSASSRTRCRSSASRRSGRWRSPAR